MEKSATKADAVRSPKLQCSTMREELKLLVSQVFHRHSRVVIVSQHDVISLIIPSSALELQLGSHDNVVRDLEQLTGSRPAEERPVVLAVAAHRLAIPQEDGLAQDQVPRVLAVKLHLYNKTKTIIKG